ncbi:MAG TPA: hypothetical protein DCK79_02745 [Candidatus Atribacteria bacterium]|nr:hypothetical protein [Candidatus Atribacteria bacterium]
MNKLSRFITKFAWPILIATIVLTILAGMQTKNLKIDDDVTKYMSEDDPEIKFYSEIVDKFGGSQSETGVITLEYKDLFQVKNLQCIKNIVDELDKAPYIKSVTSFLNMPEIISTEEGLEIKDLVEVFPKNDKEAKELKKSLLENSMVKGKFISKDGNVTLLMIEFKKGVNGKELKDNLEKIVDSQKGDTIKVYYTGMPLMSADIGESSQDTMRLSIMALILMLFILYFCFRSIRGVLLPLIVASFASVWTLGLVASTGRNVTMVASAVPILMIALATAYGIHFVSRYYEERHNFEPLKAVRMTIKDAFTPILMSALTTMAGFLSLSAAIVRPVTEFAIFSTMGIFFAFVLATFFLGSFFKLFPPPKIHEKFSSDSKDLVSQLLNKIFYLVSEKKKVVITFIVIILIGAIGFATQISPDSSMESMMGENSEIIKTLNYFKDKFGGIDTLYVYTKANNVKNPYVLRQIKKIEDYSTQLPSLREPSSISDFLIDLNDAMENKKIIPANEQKIDNLWFLTQDNEYVTSMVGDKDKDTLVSIKTAEMRSDALDSSITKIGEYIDTIPKRVKQVDLSQLKEEERQNYYPYLADEVITSLQAKGIKIKDIDNLKKELVLLAAKSNSEFESDDQEFINEILSFSSLEIKDLGITKEDIYPLFASYVQNDQSVDFFIDELMNKANLSEDDALYLEEVLEDSLSLAQEKEKIMVAQLKTEELLGKKLNDEEKSILWYLADSVVYVPDDEGDIEVSFRLSGTPVITDLVNKALFRGQIRSIILAFLMIFAMLAIQFKSLKVGLYAIIPLVLTIITSIGAMGVFHMSLNVATMMVASISIGAGVDYTIHYISRYKNELKRRNKKNALKVTLTGTGRAIIFNSISVAAGTFTLSLSSIKMMASFGQLIGSVMIVSVIYTLLLLPILLDKIDFKIKKELK